MRQMGDRPVLLQRFPNGASGSSFFQKRIPDSAPEWLETTIVSTPNGTTSRALVIADLAHFVWAVNLGCLGFHSWPMRRTTRRTATSCASTSTRARARRSRWPEDGRATARSCSTSSACAATSRPPATAGCTSTCASRRSGTRSPCAPAAVAVARELERRRPDLVTASWWKEERGAADLHRLQPERAAQDGVRPVVGARPPARPGVVPVRVGRARGHPPHDLTIDVVPAECRARRPVGVDGRRAAVVGAVPGDGAGRPGRRPARRPVAAGVPEDARRAPPGAAQPGPQAAAQGGPRHRLTAGFAMCPFRHIMRAASAVGVAEDDHGPAPRRHAGPPPPMAGGTRSPASPATGRCR